MKNLLYFCFSLCFLAIGIQGNASVVLTTFGSSSAPTFEVSEFTSLTTNQNADSIEFNGFASQELDGTFSAVDISGFSDLVRLSGSLTSDAPATDISVDLFSGTSDFGRYGGSDWSDFKSQGFVSLSLESTGGTFDPSNVNAFLLRGTGTPSQALDGQFTNLQAIPEPSAYATILGLLGLGCAVFCRRRRSSSTD